MDINGLINELKSKIRQEEHTYFPYINSGFINIRTVEKLIDETFKEYK